MDVSKVRQSTMGWSCHDRNGRDPTLTIGNFAQWPDFHTSDFVRLKFRAACGAGGEQRNHA
ncbi:hypothetical protein [Rhizobium sp. AC44/96]|uniref:hypothetical protein n=1 Tax=Rhizobium sp. AC44/96 TaxID=1841654 RepID=UPI0011474E09|nr:hypothetical protein [Rhizobium sp. AC44/96]